MEAKQGTKRGRPAQRVLRAGRAVSLGAAKVLDALVSVLPHQPSNQELSEVTGYTVRMVQFILGELERTDLVTRSYEPRSGTRGLNLNPRLLAA